MKHSKLKILLVSGIIASQFWAVAGAESLNFSGSVTVEKGSCVFTALNGMKLEYNFNSVTPLQVSSAATALENTFQVKDCAGTSGITLSLTSTTNKVLTGTYAGKWTIPATGTGKAAGLAYKTEIKSGSSSAYQLFPVDGTPVAIATSSTNVPITIKTTLIPTVSSISGMTSGNMDATAVINIAYQ